MTPTRRLRSGVIELAIYEHGTASETRPTLVLVHGYPDSAEVWTGLIAQLGERFHIVAYDVRGAGHSDRPRRVADYDLDYLVADLATVIDAVSPTRAVHLLAHDWGSIQSWEAVTTQRLRGRIASYISISGPSLDHAGHWLRRRVGSTSPLLLAQAARQLMHSWYAMMFQIPGAGAGAWKLGLDRVWPAILEKVEGVRAEPSSTQAADGIYGVNLYRANFRKRVFAPQERRTDIPVLLICPTRDHFMVREIWDDLPRWVPQLWRQDVDATHWLPLSNPALLASRAAAFIDFVETGVEPATLQRARVRERPSGQTQAGKLIVVTGAGSGFGRETAVLFSEQGADIVAVDIDEQAAERTAAQCRGLGAMAWSRHVDVGDAEQMAALAGWVEAELGAPDVVVNNAGIGMAGSFFDTSDGDWDRVLRVNLWGVIHGSRLFGQQMIAAGKRGHIVNVASMGAFTPSRFMSAYNTSKAAVLMLSDCLRAELAERGIQVSTICPGLSITNITRSTRFVGLSDEEQARRQRSATRLYERRNLKPEAIAEAILDAVEHGRELVPVGVEAHGSHLVSRLFPALSRRLARLEMLP